MGKYLTAAIFRGDTCNCSNNGISSKHNEVTLIDVPGPFPVVDSAPAVRIVKRFLSGRDYFHAEPVTDNKKQWFMFGGTFIYTSDSRFPYDYPIPLHDRVES